MTIIAFPRPSTPLRSRSGIAGAGLPASVLAGVGPAAGHRTEAMEVSDRWVREGKGPASSLLDQIRAELTASYRALVDAVAGLT